MVDISIVIPNYNGLKFIKNLILSLVSQNFGNYEIIVVDDNSTDISVVDWLKTNYKKVIVIENKTNLGFAASCNVGIRRACGNIICLLNNDTIVDENYLKRHVEYMKVNSNVAILGCVILDGENNIWYSGGSFNNGFPVHYTENINDLMETEHVTFCSAFIKKSIFDEIGLIDESYFMKYEDVDFCKRVNLIGKYRVCVLPYPLVRHVGVHASMSDYRNEYYHYKSLLKFQKKYYRKSFVKNIFMDIPFVLLVDVLRIIKAIIYQDTNKARRLMTSLNGIIRGTIKELVSIK